MSITVADIMRLPVMRNARVVAGKQGLSRKVVSLAMMEDQESTEYLQPNNFILTNGRVLASNLSHIPQFMKSFQVNNVAGIALKVGRFLEETPPFLLSAADAIGLPVIVLPDNITSSQLISAISYAIFSNEAHNADVPYEIDLIRSIIIESEDWRVLKSRAVTAGLDLRSKMGVVLIKRMSADIDEDVGEVVKSICIDSGFLHPFPLYGKYVSCINLNGEDNYSILTLERARILESRIKQALPGDSWRIGVSKARRNLLMLSLSYKEALAALSFGIAIDSSNHTLAFNDLGIYTVLLKEQNRQDVNAFLLRIVAQLELHDKTYNTDLLNTFRTYAACQMSISETAEALFVHHNTVRYRIDTIKKLITSQIVSEEIGVSLEVACTLSRWIDAYNLETKHSSSSGHA